MKTLEQIKVEQEFGEVFTVNEFAELYQEGYILMNMTALDIFMMEKIGLKLVYGMKI